MLECVTTIQNFDQFRHYSTKTIDLSRSQQILPRGKTNVSSAI